MNDRNVGEDRGRLLTEQRLESSADLDALNAGQILKVINDEDQRIPAVLGAAIPKLASLVDAVVARLERGGRLIYLGAGTSGRLGVLDAAEIPPTFQLDPGRVLGIIAGGPSALVRSSEGREDEPAGSAEALTQIGLEARDMVVGIAAGGTTPFVLGGLQTARDAGAGAALLTCVAEEDMAAILHGFQPDVLVCLPVGPEVVAGSTRMKAGTATKLALNMLSTATMVRLGKTWGNLMVDMRATNAKLRDRAVRILQSQQPGLSRAEAARWLEQADGHVKVALVMMLRNVTASEASDLLVSAHGRLRPVLGPPR